MVIYYEYNKEILSGGVNKSKKMRDAKLMRTDLSFYNYIHKMPLIHSKKSSNSTSGNKKKMESSVKWIDCDNWNEIMDNKTVFDHYLQEKNNLFKNLDLDWSDVLKHILPKLKHNKEYIGLLNIDINKKVLIKSIESSSTSLNDETDDITFASIPTYLVEKYSNKPAMFIFHTHIADIRGSPLPSSHDLCTAIDLSARQMYAGNIIFSRYGIILYGLNEDGIKSIRNSKNPHLALLNLQHDVISAHEAMRSWSKYTLDDYIHFYNRNNMFFIIYPSSEFINENYNKKFISNLENKIDHELIDILRLEIKKIKKK